MYLKDLHVKIYVAINSKAKSQDPPLSQTI